MSYRVRIESFEGPFDLLLYLVSRHKVDIGSISISRIVDQYLAYIDGMEALDLDVASDFLLVASTLLEIKAASLLPHEEIESVDELSELSPSEARDVLIERLLVYKQFKNAAAALSARFERESLAYPRLCGPDKEFFAAQPDYLAHVAIDDIGALAAKALARREEFLLESAHIAAKPVAVESCMRSIRRTLGERRHMMFSEILAESPSLSASVASFLAVLELYKRMMVGLEQESPFADIAIDLIEGSGELPFDDRDGKERS
ncbi:MAG: segregation/condensation protein A [Slackia sp.]|nr:segregation/condensation protein A [Slackia sp.]